MTIFNFITILGLKRSVVAKAFAPHGGSSDIKFGILSVPLSQKSSENYETLYPDKLDNI